MVNNIVQGIKNNPAGSFRKESKSIIGRTYGLNFRNDKNFQNPYDI
jgi:hypothetical protein